MAKLDKSEGSAAGATRKDGEKLQKVLARSGLGSRREMERWIEEGRIAVDGKLAKLGDRITGGQEIAVDGKPLHADDGEKTRCLLYHKPTGEVCSRKDPEERRTVFEALPKVKAGRWISIGRLDYNTSGLLLFTTDGELANALMHPRANIEREYMVRVMGDVSDEMLTAMLEGVMLEDGVARFTDIQPGGGDGINSWYYVVIMEGRNREVRRLWESQGLTVSRLKRVRYGELFIPSKVRKGQWQELAPKEIATLYRMAGLPGKDVQPPTREEKREHKRQDGKRGRVRGSAPGSGKRRAASPDGQRPEGRRSGKPAGLDRAGRSKRSEKSEKSEKSGKPVRAGKSGKTAKASKSAGGGAGSGRKSGAKA